MGWLLSAGPLERGKLACVSCPETAKGGQAQQPPGCAVAAVTHPWSRSAGVPVAAATNRRRPLAIAAASRSRCFFFLGHSHGQGLLGWWLCVLVDQIKPAAPPLTTQLIQAVCWLQCWPHSTAAVTGICQQPEARPLLVSEEWILVRRLVEGPGSWAGGCRRRRLVRFSGVGFEGSRSSSLARSRSPHVQR